MVVIEPCFCLRNEAPWALASAASGSGNTRVSGRSVGHAARGPGGFTGTSFNVGVSLGWAWCSPLPSCSSAGFKVATWLTGWRRLANLRRGHLLWGQPLRVGEGKRPALPVPERAHGSEPCRARVALRAQHVMKAIKQITSQRLGFS